jgi:hypothetical protein
MNDQRRQARLAGLLYFLVALTAPLGVIVAPAKLVVVDDPAATAQRLVQGAALLHAGIASELFHQGLEVFMVLVLYRLFAPVQRMLARQMLVLGLIPIPMVFLNVLTEVAAATFAAGPPWLQAFDRAQLDALALLCMRLHAHGLQLAAVFWGLWLLPLGLLMLRCGFVPKLVGGLAMAGGAGYLVGASTDLVLPGLQDALALPAFVLQLGEPVMILWLLFVGATRPRPGTAERVYA